jgi:hypothetical protein
MKTKTVVLLALAVGTVVTYKKYGSRIKEALTPTPAPTADADKNVKGCCG